MESTNTESSIVNDLIAKFKDQTAITVLIKDLELSSNFMEDDTQKKLVFYIREVLKESYAKTERDVMTKFAFDFYYELSHQMGVPENLISENLTHAEIYFDEKFNRDEAQDL